MTLKPTLFTEAETKVIQKRLNKDYSDPHSLFANRIRPKLEEMLKLTETRKKRELLKNILKRKRGKDPEPSLPMEEQSLEQFRQEVGF